MLLKKIKAMGKINKKNISDKDENNLNNHLDVLFYSAIYPDLEKNGVKIFSQLVNHYQLFGQKEGRFSNLVDWLKANKFPEYIVPSDFKFLDIYRSDEISLNSRKYILDFLDFIKSPLNKIFELPSDWGGRVNFLIELGKYYYENKFNTEANYLWSLLPDAVFKDSDLQEKIMEICGYEDEIYAELNSDILNAGLNSKFERFIHFLRCGLKENRAFSINSWLLKNGLQENFLVNVPNIKEAILRTERYGNPVKIVDALNSLVSNNSHRVWFFESPKKNSEIYVQAGLKLLEIGEKEKAKKCFLTACSFDSSNFQALEQLGHYYSTINDYKTAANFFENAISLGADASKIVPHMAWMYRASKNYERAYSVFEEYIPRIPASYELMNQVDDFVQELWNEGEHEIQMDVLLGDREKLVECTNGVVQKIYNLYMLAMGGNAAPEKIKNISISKILLVGDFFVPQCQRYRIDQKKEQLAAAGIEVLDINWVDLQNHKNDLSFYDAVIFYRVPAVPSVIKAIAQINVTERLSIYETDDLLFDPLYPPSIDTYGGAVDQDQYRGLMRGMALFNAAAKLCRVGIASTEPLREKLANIVFSGQCMLHRNGLDSYYEADFNPLKKIEKQGVYLFYGSGTLAHNNDFCDLALPAIQKIMDKRKDVHLIIAGYLQLPKRFLDEYQNRISMLPATKDINLYYDYLKMADINLAVLHSDPIADCKSELKWFEAAYFEIPSILSATRNYLDVINDGHDALLVRNSEEWSVAINRLIEDEGYRKNIAKNARERVLVEYSVEKLGIDFRNNLEATIRNICLPQKKKRVALVNVFYAPQSIGGATRVFEGNIQHFIKSFGDEIEPVIFCSNVHEGVPHHVNVEMRNGIRVYRANVIFRRNMDWEPKDEAMGKVFRRFLETEKPDCVHFHCVQRLTASIVEVTKEMGIPYIITMHDAWWFSDLQFLVDSEGNVYPDGHPGVEWATKTHPPEGATHEQSLQRLTYLRKLANGAAKIFTVSETFANICRKNGFPQVCVSQNGISSEVQWKNKDTSYTSRVVCAHIGGMSAHKGYDLLKEVIHECQPKNIEMLIVDHSREPNWKKESFWGSVPITFIGRQPQSTIQDLYAKIDVLFAPSLWPESFGLVTREAAACNCWVVASSIGSIGEDILQKVNGFRIEPNREDLIKVIKEIDSNFNIYKLPTASFEYRPDEQQAREMANVYIEVTK